jgi:hypothetical protein
VTRIGQTYTETNRELTHVKMKQVMMLIQLKGYYQLQASTRCKRETTQILFQSLQKKPTYEHLDFRLLTLGL